MSTRAMHPLLTLPLLLLAAACASPAAPPEAPSTAPPAPRAATAPAASSDCEPERQMNDRVQVCERRAFSLDRRTLVVDATPNGNVSVERGDGPRIEIVATVRATAPTRERAAALVAETRIETDGTVRADAPEWAREQRRSWVAVHYAVRVPDGVGVDIETMNGNIDVRGTGAAVRARALNGNVSLRDVRGHADARTTNGNVEVRLRGALAAEGLTAQTTNGNVDVSVPASLSATVEASTVHGPLALAGLGFEADGCHRDARHAPCTGGRAAGRMGGGGPPLRVSTVNGGLSISAR